MTTPATGPILLVGDAILDRWLRGHYDRISREAPTPVLRIDRIDETLGGAANVAKNLADLGYDVLFPYQIGDDPAGERLGQLLQNNGIRAHGVRQANSTVVASRLLASGSQVMRFDRDNGYWTSPVHMRAAIADMAEIWRPPAAIVVSDYSRGTMIPEVRDMVRELADKLDIPMFVDTRDLLQYQRPTVLKCNEHEAAAAMPQVKLRKQLRGMAEQTAASQVVITLGGHGAACFDRIRNEEAYADPPTLHRVCDVAGAGDTFMAALVDAYMGGYDLHRAVQRANVAAGLVVAKPGTASVSRAELELAWIDSQGSAAKVVGRAEFSQIAKWCRDMGQSVVLTNGCFDLLHPGHIASLQWAAKQGRKLLVAVNDDASTAALKGPGRPIVPGNIRAAQLAQLEYVAAVHLFSETEVTDVVKAVQPDILVKGAEYRGKDVPGADFVAYHGGDVRFAPMFGGYHTTAIATKLEQAKP